MGNKPVQGRHHAPTLSAAPPTNMRLYPCAHKCPAYSLSVSAVGGTRSRFDVHMGELWTAAGNVSRVVTSNLQQSPPCTQMYMLLGPASRVMGIAPVKLLNSQVPETNCRCAILFDTSICATACRVARRAGCCLRRRLRCRPRRSNGLLLFKRLRLPFPHLLDELRGARLRQQVVRTLQDTQQDNQMSQLTAKRNDAAKRAAPEHRRSAKEAVLLGRLV